MTRARARASVTGARLRADLLGNGRRAEPRAGRASRQVLLPLPERQLLEQRDGRVEIGSRLARVALVAALLGLDGERRPGPGAAGSGSGWTGGARASSAGAGSGTASAGS